MPAQTAPTEPVTPEARHQGHAYHTSALPATALDDLFDVAASAFMRGESPGRGWTSAAAGAIARAISDGEAAQLSAIQTRLRSLAAAARRAQTASDESRSTLQSITDQLRVLTDTADAGIDLSRPRARGRLLDPKSLPARILVSLLDEDEVFNDSLLTEMGVHATQLSRAGRDLIREGLVIRRHYGKRVSWSLTQLGREQASSVQRKAANGESRENQEVVVTATTPKDFDAAIKRAADAIVVPLKASDARSAVLAKYVRTSVSEAVGSGLFSAPHPPRLLVNRDAADGYILDDLTPAKSLTRRRKASPRQSEKKA